MKRVLTRADDQALVTARVNRDRRRLVRQRFSGRSFRQLTPEDKEALLNELAVSAGLLVEEEAS